MGETNRGKSKKDKELTLGSLFDGIAGFPLAAAGLGIKTIWTSEIEPNCVGITARHFPEAKQLGDITKLDGAKIDPVDIISFGSPCQNLSIAGDQRGLEGEKSRLFFEAVRIVYEMRGATDGKYPKYIIWENVAGAFSSNKGKDFQRVLEEITKTRVSMPASGRWAASGMVRNRGGCTAWRTMDAQYWGTPQRRTRIFLVRSFGNGRAAQILFERESVLGYSAPGGGEAEDDTAGIEDCASGTDSRGMAQDADGQMTLDFGRTADRIYINPEKSVTLKGTDGGGGAATGLYMLPVFTIAGNAIGRMGKNGGNQLGIGQDVSYTLTKADRHCVAVPELFLYQDKIGPICARDCKGVGNQWIGENKLIIQHRKGGYRVRRLTPTECERLQGFPDGWTEQDTNGRRISDSKRYMALGNSIAVPCAVRVFAGILLVETEKMENESGAD